MSALSDHALETFKSLISISREAFKALQLLNGGAVIALLTYIGHDSATGKLARVLARPMQFFVVGLILATLAYGTAYLTQYTLFNEEKRKASGLSERHGIKHELWVIVTSLISLGSLGCFSVGALSAVSALAQ